MKPHRFVARTESRNLAEFDAADRTHWPLLPFTITVTAGAKTSEPVKCAETRPVVEPEPQSVLIKLYTDLCS